MLKKNRWVTICFIFCFWNPIQCELNWNYSVWEVHTYRCVCNLDLIFFFCVTLWPHLLCLRFSEHTLDFIFCVLRFSEDIQVTSGAVDDTIQFVFALDLTMVHDSRLFTKSVQLWFHDLFSLCNELLYFSCTLVHLIAVLLLSMVSFTIWFKCPMGVWLSATILGLYCKSSLPYLILIVGSFFTKIIEQWKK